jgi:hypothetical protein
MMKQTILATAALAACVGGFSGGAGAATMSPRAIIVRPGESPDQIRRQVAWAQAYARSGLTVLPNKAVHDSLPTDAAPTIVSGAIVSQTINVTVPPATPEVKIKYKSPGLLSFIELEFVSPAGNYLYSFYDAPVPKSKSGTVTYEYLFQSLSLWAQSGTWTLSSAEIVDAAGNYTLYDASQLGALFPSLNVTVVNPGQVDYTPPTISAGTILTPTVKASAAYPYFEAQLSMTDDVSGVAYPLVFISPPNGDYSESYDTALPLPELSVMALSATPLDAFGPIQTGLWSIMGFGGCDLAENCTYDFNASDVQTLFGTTTFKVTK